MPRVIWSWPREWAGVTDADMGITVKALGSSSPFQDGRRIAGPYSERWACTLSFASKPPNVWPAIEAFLLRLDGTTGLLRMFDPYFLAPRGVAAGWSKRTAASPLGEFTGAQQPFSDGTLFSDGTGWVDGSQYGVVARAASPGDGEILISGLVASQAISIASGDRFQLGDFLHAAVAQCASDASGFALVPIRPRLKQALSIGDLVQFAYPTSVFSLAQQTTVARGVDWNATFSLSLVEAPSEALL